VALAEIGAWRQAAAAGVIYSDVFQSDALAPFWTKASPHPGVLVGDGHLVLRSGAELISKPVRLGGKPVEFVIARDKQDGVYNFLPLEGHPVLSTDLVDETGQPVCHLIWHTIRGDDGNVRGMFQASLGRGPLRNMMGMPVLARVMVDAGGRIVVVKGDGMVQLVGSAGRRLSAVSLRLGLSNSGGKDVSVRWTQFAVQRLEGWPEWAQPGRAKEATEPQ
jgi:hypothetical protein